MERSYIAFISYRHTKRDAAIAKQVHTLIESYVIPKSLRKGSQKLGVVFRDEEELPISSDLTESIRTALDASKYLIVICSPEMKESPWVAREINYFLQNHDASNVFVVLADGEPNDVFPQELTHILNRETGEYEDVEPLAMDVRADSIAASLKKAKAHIRKLYAGMLGCSYDSLVQREKMRRLKRIAALVIVAVLLAGCFIGMLFIKNRELSRKNDELTAAIELALMRESELLTEEAEEALGSEDIVAAMQYAVNALPSGDVERPYYAPAERVLFTAIDVLREWAFRPLISKVTLKHSTPIEMMAYNADGSAIYVIDSYGTVSCFDTAAGDLIWDIKLNEKEDTYTVYEIQQIHYDGENDILTCYRENIVSGVEASTGRLLWQTEIEHHFVGGPYFCAREPQIGYIEQVYFHDPEGTDGPVYKYDFTVLSTLDGSVLHKVPLERLTESTATLNKAFFGQCDNSASGSAFEDAGHFAETVFKEENGVVKMQLCTIDLSENSVSYIESDTIIDDRDYLKTCSIGNGRFLALSRKLDENPQTGYREESLRIQCFDAQEGFLLWESTAHTEASHLTYCDRFVLPYNSETLIGIGNNIFVVDNDSGEVLVSAQCGANIIDMYPLTGNIFAYTLADGQCALGWYSREDVYDSSFFSATISLPATSGAIAHNGGLIQLISSGGTLEGFRTTPKSEGGGSIAYLSEDGYSACIASILPSPALPEPVPVDMKNAPVQSMGDFIDSNQQGKVLMGFAQLEDGYGLITVDTQNYSADAVKLWEHYPLYDYSCYLTADGSVLVCSEYGDIQITGPDGSASVLAESESTLPEMEYDVLGFAERFKADAARLSSSGKVFAARSDGQQLCLYFEGEEEKSVPLPENVRWSIPGGNIPLAMFHAGNNGLVVLSDFVSGDADAIGNFAVYDVSSGKWTLIPDTAHGAYDRIIAMAEKEALFAVYDADMNIRVYSSKSAEPVQCIYTGYPVSSVEKTGILLDDQYIYTLAKDGQFIIYDIGTGDIIFRTIFSSTIGKAFSNWLDRENSRLYMHVGADALCVDMRSWEQLFFSGRYFKFYSAAQNECYIFDYDAETFDVMLKAIKIPNTNELVDIVQETLY